MKTRKAFVNQMRSYIGARDGNAQHKQIVDTYNSYLPHPRGYTLTMNDPWCAATVSAASIALGYTNITPIECSCSKLIEIAKKMGIWQERDDYVPNLADWVIYDWEDDGKGDCTGKPNHVGSVESVAGSEFIVIEGNKGYPIGECARRTMKVNGRYIRGFICPRYDEEPNTEPQYYVVKRGDVLSKIAVKFNTTVSNLMALNPQIKNPNLIYTGQTIRVK